MRDERVRVIPYTFMIRWFFFFGKVIVFFFFFHRNTHPSLVVPGLAERENLGCPPMAQTGFTLGKAS